MRRDYFPAGFLLSTDGVAGESSLTSLLRVGVFSGSILNGRTALSFRLSRDTFVPESDFTVDDEFSMLAALVPEKGPGSPSCGRSSDSDIGANGHVQLNAIAAPTVHCRPESRQLIRCGLEDQRALLARDEEHSVQRGVSAHVQLDIHAIGAVERSEVHALALH